MPKAIVIFTEKIHDPEGMAAYSAAAGKTLGDGQVTVLAVDQNAQVLEGEWHGNQTVVLQFDSVEAARAWYDSPAYQEAKKLRQAAAETNAVIITGF
ncbi:MAG: DUF1330 domain-containing protein [Frankia sp.]|nr:DUF1330 domain-containing protein [Frankia sp.]